MIDLEIRIILRGSTQEDMQTMQTLLKDLGPSLGKPMAEQQHELLVRAGEERLSAAVFPVETTFPTMGNGMIEQRVLLRGQLRRPLRAAGKAGAGRG